MTHSHIKEFLDLCREKTRASPEGLFELEDELHRFAISGGFVNWFNEHLAMLDSQKSFELLSVDAKYLVLYEEPGFSVELIRVGRTTKYLYRYPAHAVYVNLGTEAVPCKRYRLSEDGAALEGSEDWTLDSFSTLLRDGYRHIVDFKSSSGDEQLLARIVSSNVAADEISFDRSTLRRRLRITTNQLASYTYCMAEFAGTLRSEACLENLYTVVQEHKEPWVRWRAVINIGKIDPGAARALVTRLASDSDDQIRDIADRTLRMNRA